MKHGAGVIEAGTLPALPKLVFLLIIFIDMVFLMFIGFFLNKIQGSLEKQNGLLVLC